jgi:hypothetical protein
MKKGLAALAAACFLFGGTGKAQAVIGIPDDVPGNSLLFPFFTVNANRNTANGVGSDLDTLVVITNTGNVGSSGSLGGDLEVHIAIWTVRSEHVYDFNITLTHHDVFSCSLYDILVGGGCTPEDVAPAPPIAAQLLAVDDTGLLAGYITADVVTAQTSALPDNLTYPFGAHNVLIGHEYLVDLPNGSATGLNAVSIESTTPLFGHPASPAVVFSDGFYNDDSPVDNLERFSGWNGDQAQTASGGDSDEFDLIVRYFSASALNGRTSIWLWKECNGSDEIDLEDDLDDTECANSATLNVSVYDEDENVHSITFNFPDEVNFVLINPFVTPGVNGGWLRLPVDPEVQATAYTVQRASEERTDLRWDAVFPAHRQYTDYLGGDVEE